MENDERRPRIAAGIRVLLGAAIAVAGSAPAVAQTPSPVGLEFQVNTYTTGNQPSGDPHMRRPSVAVDASGDFIVVWSSDGSSGTDTSSDSIQGQRYASDGTSLGGEFQVNTFTPNDQRFPSVAVEDNGDFVVVWQSPGSSGTDTSDTSIQGQRYAAAGAPLGGQFQVNTYTTGIQNGASVALDADGDFVVVWSSYGSSGTDTSLGSVQAQRYAANGSPLGGQFQVNSFTPLLQYPTSVSIDPDGDFVVVWTSDGSSATDTSALSVHGQRYAANGTPAGGEFQVNTFTPGLQRYGSVGVDTDGDFVVVWASSGGSLPELGSYTVQGQRYAANGTPSGGQFLVNTYTTGVQTTPAVAVKAAGDFVVVWHSEESSGPDPTESIQGQAFAADGTLMGGEFQVNTYTTSTQFNPSVQVEDDGDFVVVWESNGSSGTDTNGRSVHGQRFLPEPDGILAPLLGVGLLMLLARRRSSA